MRQTLGATHPQTTDRAGDAGTARSRIGHHQLAALDELISDRDRQILECLRRFQLANTDQIRRQVFFGHTSASSARRTVQRCLGRLATHGLLEAIGRRIGGIRAGSASKVWTLTPLGYRLIGTDKRKYRRQPSILHIRHKLAITELATDLTEHTRHQNLNLELVTEPDCWRHHQDHTPPLKPDLYTTVANDDTELVWFVEVDRGTESSTAITTKLQRYTNYYRTGIEQAEHEVFPLTLWIAFDQQRAEQLRKTIAAAGRVDPELFRVTTAERAVEALCDFTDDPGDESKNCDEESAT